MKTLFYAFTFLLLVSCGQTNKGGSNQEDSTTSVDAKSFESTESTFDVNSIPVSNANIGDFPYLSAPEGYKYSSDEQNRKYEEKYFFYNDSLMMTVGGKYYHTRIVPNDGEEFTETYVVKNYQQAISKLGGVEVYSGGMVDKASDLLRKNNMTYAKDLYDPYAYNYKQFVLRTSSGNVWIELCHGLNINAIDFTVIFESEMEETIKIVKADELKNTLDKDGKAVLYINFEIDKSTLMPEGVAAVDEIGILLKNDPSLKLSIEGHTDNTGAVSHNNKLSLDRAQSIVKKLGGLNIAADRLKAVGYGSEKPLVSNDTDANKVKNRRVEIVKMNR
ncbi:MAG: OmpA family protein [Dysgonomonas sp.]